MKKQTKTDKAVLNGSAEVTVTPDMIERCWPFFFPVLLFLACAATGRSTALLFAALCVVLTVGRRPMEQLRQRLTPLTLAVLAYVVICLIAGWRSDFGTYAISEAVRVSIAGSFFFLVLARMKREGLRGVITVLAGCCAVISLICIDGSSAGFLTQAYVAGAKLLGIGLNAGAMGYETGVRITGMYANANVSAGILAFGVLACVYLVRTADTRRRSPIAFLLLGINALAFFLSFSLGAVGAFALACLLYLLTAGKGNRFSLFLLMMESVLVTLICAFLAYPCLGRAGAAAVVPLLCAPVCGLGIWVLDRFAGSRLAEKLAGKDRAVGLTMAGLITLLAVYVVLAVNITGGIELAPGETLSRAAYLSAGVYTASAEGGDAQAVIYSQNEAELMMHTNTPLYAGPLASAAFTVPENSKIVWFDLTAEGETALQSVTLSDGTALHLRYLLLPGFVANRLEGLWANQNFIQRLVFFRDGIALWKQSPVLGFGLGAVEGRLTNVQSFYYESKYIHNQFIQIMDEAGLVGLASLLFLLLSAVWTLVRRRKEERGPEFAFLAACLTMTVTHSMTEVVWSVGAYQAVVFLLLAVLIVCFGQPVPQLTGKLAPKAVTGAVWAVTLFFAAGFLGTTVAQRQFAALEPANRAELMRAMERLIHIDHYGSEPYKANLIANGIAEGGTTEARAKAAKYAQQLRDANEYDACYDAARYYYLPLLQLDKMFDASRAAIAQEGSNADAWNYQVEFYQWACTTYLGAAEMPAYLKGVNDTAQWLAEFNQGRMQPIILKEENQAFLDFAAQLTAAGGSDAEAYAALAAYLPE